jgi:hypothetical protein
VVGSSATGGNGGVMIGWEVGLFRGQRGIMGLEGLLNWTVSDGVHFRLTHGWWGPCTYMFFELINNILIDLSN